MQHEYSHGYACLIAWWKDQSLQLWSAIWSLTDTLGKQVIMEFPEAFWEASVDYFGAAVPGGPAARGRCFMFWNLQRFAQKPILTAVVAGEAAEVRAPRLTSAELSLTSGVCKGAVVWDVTRVQS